LSLTQNSLHTVGKKNALRYMCEEHFGKFFYQLSKILVEKQYFQY